MYKALLFLVLTNLTYSQEFKNIKSTRNAYVFIYEGFTALDMIGPQHVFASIMGLSVKTFAVHKNIIKSDTGVSFKADYTIDELDFNTPFLLIIPGGSQGTLNVISNNSLIQKIKALADKSTLTYSICTGSFIMAKTGLLQRATTHWAALDILKEYKVTPEKKRFVQDRKFFSSAGVSAGIDGALHIASKLVNENYAKSIQLAMEYDPKPPFNSGSTDTASTQTVETLQYFYKSFVEKLRVLR